MLFGTCVDDPIRAQSLLHKIWGNTCLQWSRPDLARQCQSTVSRFRHHRFHISACMQIWTILQYDCFQQLDQMFTESIEQTVGTTDVFTSSCTAAATPFTSMPAIKANLDYHVFCETHHFNPPANPTVPSCAGTREWLCGKIFLLESTA